MLKRIFSLIMAIMLILATFSSCGDSEQTSSKAKKAKKADKKVSSDKQTVSQDTDDEPEEEIEYIYEYIDEDGNIYDESKSVPATCSKSFTTLPAEHTSLLSSNPDRGWRSEQQLWVPSDINVLRKTTYNDILSDVKATLSTNTQLETVTVCRLYFIMNYYKDIYELPAETVQYLDNYMKAYQEIGVKVYFEVYYQHGLDYGDIGASKATVLHHLDTYGLLWKKYKDNLYAVNFGLIGSYGEWSALKPMLSTADKTEIVNKVAKLVPEDTYLIIRLPKYKRECISKSSPLYNRVGYAADAFFGKMFPNDDYGQGNWRPDNEEWQISVKESPYSIMDGELFTTRWFKENGIYVDPISSIKAFSELHMTTFSVNHGYADISLYGGTLPQTVLYGWKCEEITNKIINDLGVLVTPTWFSKSDGSTVKRNTFEYVRDYLGYNIAAQELKVTGGNSAGNSINVSMSLKNYGFSAAFNLKSGFAILDKNNNVVSEVYAGDPSKWYSTDPKNYSDRKQLTHNITAKMVLPKQKGTYKIAFFMKNSLGQTARLNNTVEYSDGFNILHMFTID